MEEFDGKTVLVSGGAEGIGLSVARAMGARGMNVVLADIDAAQLEMARQDLTSAGIPVLALTLDVAKLEQWQQVAEQAVSHFGQLHMLVNNAGVAGTAGGFDNTDEAEWRWAVDVNLLGVAFGTQTVVPLIKAHGEGGWIVNVASMAGFGPLPGAAPYSATKAAVVAMSEGWRMELAPNNIKVSVLCPGFVNTRIYASGRNKPHQRANSAGSDSPSRDERAAFIESVVTSGMEVNVVGERVVEALRADEQYIFTHPNYRDSVKARWKAVDAAFENAEQSPLLTQDVVPDLPFGG
ncbi:MAG: SDR family NAD(P)-dependent oxidoreductase [Pseudomonadota bacterium]